MSTTALSDTAISPAQRVAALMILLGEEAGALILRELEPPEVGQITSEMLRLRKVAPELGEAALREFNDIVSSGNTTALGGPDFVRRTLEGAFGNDGAAVHLKELSRPQLAPSPEISIDSVDPGRFALIVRNEHPQTIAVLLSRLGPQRAAVVVDQLPVEIRSECLFRLATIDQIAPSTVEHVLGSLDKQLKSLGQAQKQSLGGVKMAAELCNQIDNVNADLLLSEIEQKNEGLANEIRNQMFVFEDLLGMDADTLREIVGRLDRKNLVIALKGSTEQLRNHIKGTLPRRAADMLSEEIDSLGPVKIRTVESAKRELIESLREMERDGVVNLRSTSNDDFVK